jgi:hypothetical protein
MAVCAARRREVFRRAEQHRGVPVVAAGVHAAVVLRSVRKAVCFLDRQRVHVGAQPQRFPVGTVFEHADDARFSDAAVHLDAERLELRRDEIRGALLLEAELGVRVQVAPPSAHLAVDFPDRLRDGHLR